jgi:hypothetical protein
MRLSASSLLSARKLHVTASATPSLSAAWSIAVWNATNASKAGKFFAAKAASRPTTVPDYHDGTISKGGYTDHIVVRDHFVLKVPEGMDVSRVAPLLCAGHHDLFAVEAI